MKLGEIERVWWIPEGKCPYCMWADPHRHLLRADGSLGVIVEPLDEVLADATKAPPVPRETP